MYVCMYAVPSMTCPVHERNSPPVGISASCPVTSTAAREITEEDSGALNLTVTIYKNFSPHICTQSTFCGRRNVFNSSSENDSRLLQEHKDDS